MSWRREGALLIAAVTLMACGASSRPLAQTSPDPTHQPSPTATLQVDTSPSSSPTTPVPARSPASSPEPTPAAAAASVKCTGGPGMAMVVIARTFVYDVADPLHPRLACRGANTVIHLLERNAIAYTTVV